MPGSLWVLECLLLTIVAPVANGFSLGSGIGAKAPSFPMQRTQAAQIAGRMSTATVGPFFMSSSSTSNGKKNSKDGLDALARRNAEEASVLGKFLEIRPPRPTQRLSDYVASTPANAGEEAVVVGGGPVGMAAGMMLARKGWDVTVLDKRSSASAFETEKAYVYLVDQRGQQFTDEYGDITKGLFENGISMDLFKNTRVWGDSKGAVVTKNMMSSRTSDKPGAWISRSAFLSLLDETAMDMGVKVKYGTTVTDMEVGEGQGGRALITSSDGTTYRPKLLLGCDGIYSSVRDFCGQVTGDPEGFAPKSLPSASTGLHYKMLVLPPSFDVANLTAPGANMAIEPHLAYNIQSKQQDRRRLGLGLLPAKGKDSMPRTANIIQPKWHAVWKCASGKELLSFLEDSFPQLQVSKYISLEQADSWVASRAGIFPAPQYVSRLIARAGDTGIVLLGDAIHAFPPDIGQGVNAGLEDVVDFEKAMEVVTDPSDSNQIDKALKEYQRVRAPEAKAVVHIAQIGFPFQYSQSMNRSKIFLLHVAIRSAINLIASVFKLGTVFNKPAIMMMSGNRYSTVWRRAQRTTAIYVGMSAAAATWLMAPKAALAAKVVMSTVLSGILWGLTTCTAVRSWAYSLPFSRANSD